MYHCRIRYVELYRMRSMISLMTTFRLASDVVGLVGRDWSVRRLHRRDFLFHRLCFTFTTTRKIRYFAQTPFARYQKTIFTLKSPSLSSLLQLSLHSAASRLSSSCLSHLQKGR